MARVRNIKKKSPGYVYLCTAWTRPSPSPKNSTFSINFSANFMFKLTLNVEMNVLINPRKQKQKQKNVKNAKHGKTRNEQKYFIKTLKSNPTRIVVSFF